MDPVAVTVKLHLWVGIDSDRLAYDFGLLREMNHLTQY